MTKKNEKKKAGRPPKITDEKLQKLKDAFAMGETDQNACIYAGIKERTFYNFQQKNSEFLQEKEQLKLQPILKAKATIFKNLSDVKVAMWYLERKRKEEFSTKTETTLETNGLNIIVADKKHQKMIEDL